MNKIRNVFWIVILLLLNTICFADVALPDGRNADYISPYQPSYYLIFCGCALGVIVICGIILIVLSKNNKKPHDEKGGEQND